MKPKLPPQLPLLLVFGLPRSGTTWLAKIFDSHPRTLYRHEPDRFPRLETISRFPSVDEADNHAQFLRSFVAELPQRVEPEVIAKMPLFQKAWQSRFDYTFLRASVLLTKFAERGHVKLPIIGATAKHAAASSLVVWKSIESMGRFGLAMRALDNAKGIHLVRHPCGHINSVLRGEGLGKFHGDSPNSELYKLFALLAGTPQAQRRGLTLEYFRSLTPVQRLAWRWVLVNEKAMEETRDNERVRILRYEDVCENPLEVGRALFEFSGLEWDRQAESFIGQSVEHDAGAYYSVYKKPQHSMWRWRDELAAKDIDQILAILRGSDLSKLYREDEAAAGSCAAL